MTPCSRSPSSWNRSRWKTSTSSRSACTRTWIFIPASSCAPWASPPRCSPPSSPWRARRAGSRNGARWWPTRRTRSLARASFTPDCNAGSSCPWRCGNDGSSGGAMKRDALPGTALYSGSLAYLAALEEQHPELIPAPPPVRFAKKEAVEVSDLPLLKCEASQVGVLQLINAHRFHGFRAADLDPLKRQTHTHVVELDPSNHGLTPAELDQEFECGSLAGPPRDTLRNIIQRARTAYCGTLSAEYMYLTNTQRKRWLQRRLEGGEGAPAFDRDLQRWLLGQLTAAETLERTLHTRYVGQKRFSLEGGESLIPLLNDLIAESARAGVQEIGLGMAHRGRLNVLHNVLGRSAVELFEHAHHDEAEEGKGSGDVKYHQGFAAQLATPGGPIRVVLAFNPSHLEIVNPVVEGWVRAQQQRRGDMDGSLVMPILIHGDAALAGQGVVMETLNMAHTRGFSSGGTIHIVINNQIGFTTSDPRDTRSSLYSTDVMKMVEAPVLHVNGDDPEAVIRAARIAIAYRMAWKRDITIDLICYRRLGHNEQDEPMATQPLMYRRINALPSTRALYAERLTQAGVIGAQEGEGMVDAYRASLDAPADHPARTKNEFAASWTPYKGQDWRTPARTAIPENRLQALSRRLVDVPAGFTLHPRVRKIVDDRARMGEGAQALDWGMAECLAYASLLSDGVPVRLSGQDAGRGTFFHRHAVLHDQNRERWDSGSYIPLQHLIPGQANFLVIDSLLSEEAVLGFEYGYAGAAPDQLVIWEAQFGDFANGAQVLIDQFIAAAETKWGLLNGLVMLLPHGYEGQGPEHSSGRIERYLQLAAENNIQVTQPTTPSQIFHLLRRQIVRPYRKPLIVFTPKSLLRHPEAISDRSELTAGEFHVVLDDPRELNANPVTRLVFCSGRIYYDLAAACRAGDLTRIALIRVEQIYPFPDQEISALLKKYPHVQEIVWAQDEPMNQGVWRFIAYQLRQLSGFWLIYAGRPESASPATGIASLHKKQLAEILATALENAPEK
ncbi:MAG: 2-oxoglutarate dehydrogenase E1 component [Betaproteobacteria bacterium]|nr:2-oxoglutarate dehydrogenase E1 component [Betaproteobacteria bacterium]